MQRKIVYYLLVILFPFFIVSCMKDDVNVNAARLRVKLTDAPSDVFLEFHIDIKRIEILHTTLHDSLNEKWTVLDFKGIEQDVIPLSNGKSKQIIDQYFPAGNIRQVKIVFGTNNFLKTAEGTMEIIVPKEVEEGVIVDADINLYSHVITYLMIDIDAMQSVYKQNGVYMLKPVIRVFSETYGGALKGYVTPIEAKPRVIIIKNKDTLLTIPESNGMFLFRGLHEGVWEIKVIPSFSSGYQDTVFTDTIFTGIVREIKDKIELKKIGE